MEYKLLWVAGVALMATFAVISGWSLHTRNAGVRAMEDAQRQLFVGHAPIETREPPAGEPDTSTWSAKRIFAYRAAILEQQAPLALLRVPALNLAVPVFEGTSEWSLNRGAGRIRGTAAIAAEGNLGIAGHRDGFFRPLRKIRVGDTVIVEGITMSDHYRVTQLKIVEPTDVGVLQTTPTPTLTLVTCYPFYYIGPAPQRFIVHAARIHSFRSGEPGGAR